MSGVKPSGRPRLTTASSTWNVRQVITTTKAAAGAKASGSYLGEPYWPGFYAFGDLLTAWRDKGDLDGLMLDLDG